MTNQEILEKAITQAVEDGWDRMGWSEHRTEKLTGGLREGSADYGMWVGIQDKSTAIWISAEEIIFDHQFAKAFWGEGRPSVSDIALSKPMDEVGGWTWHLQQQVISDDPIKYLEKGLASRV